MTPRQFNNMVTGWKEREEADFKHQMYLHRELIVTLMAPNLPASERKKPIATLYPLPWEQEKGKTKPKGKKGMTPEEVKEWLASQSNKPIKKS